MSFLLPSVETRAKLLETYWSLFKVPLIEPADEDKAVVGDEEDKVGGVASQGTSTPFGGGIGARPSIVSGLMSPICWLGSVGRKCVRKKGRI